jgi:RimJ/RimL family protein N-acetyltransferase
MTEGAGETAGDFNREGGGMDIEEEGLGPKITFRPAQPPRREPLTGRYVRLEPVDPERHAADLFELSHGARGDPAIWIYMGYGPFADFVAFKSWVAERAASNDPLFYAVIDLATGKAAGMASFLRIVPADGVIETGHIWLTPILQRTRQATEAIFLMAKYAFDTLGNRRFEWKCNARNAPSRAAAKRFGFTFEGVFRQHMIVKGRNRDTAWYAMIDRDWPAIKAAFEAWLDPANFDAKGQQKKKLNAAAFAAAQPF